MIGYVKMSPIYCRIHEDVVKMMSDIWSRSSKEATCSNNTHICDGFCGPAWGGMAVIKGERVQLHSDRAEKHDDGGDGGDDGGDELRWW